MRLEDVKGSGVGSEAFGSTSGEITEIRLLNQLKGSEYMSESESSVQSRSVEGEIAPAAISVEQDFLDGAEIERRSRFLLTQIPDWYKVVGWFRGSQMVHRLINRLYPNSWHSSERQIFNVKLSSLYISGSLPPTSANLDRTTQAKAPYADVRDTGDLEDENEPELLCSLSTVIR